MRWHLDQSAILSGLLVLATALLALQSLRLWLRGGVERRRATRARTLGRSGERRARRLLERARYRIESEQPSGRLTFHVDGEERQAHLRPDFLVRRGGQRFIADAKAGADAVDLGKRATRRQLLEYALAFPDVAGILLVDTETGRIHQVEFPGLDRSRRPRTLETFGLGLVCGAGALAGLLRLADF